MDLNHIAAALEDSPEEGNLPVERWNPDHCGEIDISIRTDGSWWHEGTPIGRPALVRLFSRVLRKDPEGYVLVTPAEKLSITVEDVPFVITTIERNADLLTATTNVGDCVSIGRRHPLEMRSVTDEEAAVPYIQVRHDLWGRLSRAAYYRLIDEEADISKDRAFITSDGTTFDLGVIS